MYFSEEVLKNIENTIGFYKPECGGIIAMDQDGVISDYYFDVNAGYGKASYIPSRLNLQNHIRENWSSQKLQFCGVVHSHPFCNTCEPSHIDIKMAVKIMATNNMDKFYLLMVQGHEMKLYYVTNNDFKSCFCQEEKIEIQKKSHEHKR